MSWETIINPKASAIDQFGGVIINRISQLYNDIDVGADYRPTINTIHFWRPDKLYIVGQEGTYTVGLTTPTLTKACVYTIPETSQGSGVDEFLLKNTSATVINKTFSLNNNIITATGAAWGHLVYHNGTGYINLPIGTTNKSVLAITGDPTINTIGWMQPDSSWLSDNANIVKTNQANNFGDFNQEFMYNRLRVRNLANDAVVGLAYLGTVNRTLQIPALTATDTVATRGIDNAFYAAQYFQTGTVPQIRLRNSSSPVNGLETGLDFISHNSASINATYVRIRATHDNVTQNSEAGTLEFMTRHAGAFKSRFRFQSDGIFSFGENLRAILSEAGLTAARTYTFPDATTQLAGVSVANTYTSLQTFEGSNADIISVRQNVNTVGASAGIYFTLKDSLDNNTSYAGIYGRILSNTDLQETGYLGFFTRELGTWAQQGRISAAGFQMDSKYLLSVAGLTALRTITFPNQDTLLAGQNFANTFTAIQNISVDTHYPLTVRRPATNAQGPGIAFHHRNVANVEKALYYLSARWSDSTDGQEDGALWLIGKRDGADVNHVFFGGGTNDIGLYNSAGTFYCAIRPSAFTTNFAATIPVLTANDTFAFKGINNNFTTPQSITVSGNDALFTVHSTNLVGSRSGIYFALRDSANNTTAYGGIYSEIMTNTDLSEEGSVVINLRSAGGWLAIARVETDGLSMINKYKILTTGLTAFRSFTLPNANGELLTNNSTLDITKLTPGTTSGHVLTWNGTTIVWAAAPGSGGGSSDTASNLGTGIAVFKQKVSGNYEFKTLQAASNKISIAANADGNHVDINVNEANLSTVEKIANKNVASGYAGLNTSSKVEAANLPDASTTAKGIVELATSAETTAGLAVQASDTRLSDARTPTAHTHPLSQITDANTLVTLTGAQNVQDKTFNGYKLSLSTKTAGYTLVDTDTIILADATTAGFTLTLPAASTRAGKEYIIQKTDSTNNVVTIDANASETINGQTTFLLSAQYQVVTLRCNGTAWFVAPNSIERRGRATANGTGAQTTFTIAHGLGMLPHSCLAVCSSHPGMTYTRDATNITCVFSTAPANGTNNVIIEWSVTA